MVDLESIYESLDGWVEELGFHQAIRTNQFALSLIKESQELIRRFSEQGWELLGSNNDSDVLTMEQEHDAIREARHSARQSPLIIAGIKAYQLLVHARGRTIKALDDDINLIIQKFLKANRKIIFSQQMKLKKEKSLWTDDRFYFRIFINPDNGIVIIRFVDPLQIKEVITDPDDEESRWFYLRCYSHSELDGTVTERTVYYPDISFMPVEKERYKGLLEARHTARGLGQVTEIDWNTPIYCILIDNDLHAALPWARCYENSLQVLMAVFNAYSTIAMMVKTEADQVDLAAQQMQRHKGTYGNVIATNLKGDIKTLNAKSASIPPSEFLPYLKMVSMVFTLSPHLFGEEEAGGGLGSDQNRYEAMNLAIEARQNLWKDIELDLIQIALLQAIKAGTLRNKGRVREYTVNGLRYEEIEWNHNVNAGINIVYPPVRKRDVKSTVDALIKVATMDGKRPLELITPRVLYQALAEVLPLGDVEAQLERIPEEWTADGSMIESPRMALRTLERLVESLRSLDANNEAL